MGKGMLRLSLLAPAAILTVLPSVSPAQRAPAPAPLDIELVLYAGMVRGLWGRQHQGGHVQPGGGAGAEEGEGGGGQGGDEWSVVGKPGYCVTE